MFVISMKKVKAYGIFICLVVSLLTFSFLRNENAVIETNADSVSYRIVVDAGHGKPDGGAVSDNGIEEEALNLSIALKLRDELESLNYDVIMTRNTNENIADSDKKNSIKEIKNSDLNNRVKIANESKADFMISIHMNKFDQSSSWGWQTFYSKNSEDGKLLAELVQSSISEMIDRPNKRTILPIDGIKIVDKTTIPVIIVECGFLSNEEDLRLLETNEYQQKIVTGIVQAIEEYYSRMS